MKGASRVRLALCLGLLPATAGAFGQRPLNLGSTTVFDGGGAPPGLLWMTYVQLVSADRALDQDGRAIPGGARMSALSNLNQLFYLSPLKLAGAYLGLNVIVPLAAPSVQGALGPAPLSANTAGLGDPTFGLALQWNDRRLFGVPLQHRLEADVFAPWGKYDERFTVNPGQNFTTLEGYYAFTLSPSRRLEASGRLHYAWNTENAATKRRAGPLFHANLDASYAVLPMLRAG
ncbi:MAG: transporter, partial [Elusimicrobia bacterium]|nr:transporter [Elusimicrobiota bacterium]